MTNVAMAIMRSLSLSVCNQLKKNSIETENMKISIVSIIANLEIHIIPGITLNKKAEIKAVLLSYSLRAISKMTKRDNTEKVAATSLPAKMPGPIVR